MSTETQWFVMQEDQQLGPYTGQQLADFAAAGNIVRETMVWAEGMENWLPASQIDGLFPEMPLQPPQPAPGNLHPAGNLEATSADPAGPYPHIGVSGASFGMWMGLLFGGLALGIIALVVIAKAEEGGRLTGAATVILLGLGGVGYLLMLISSILTLVYIFRAWKCLEPGGMARTSPGAAVGLMFVPFFNLYWIFQAIHGLSVDWNRTVDAYPDIARAPKLAEGMFLTYCITSLVFPPVAIVLIFPVMAQLCRGISFFAFRPSHHAPGQVGFSLR